MSAPFVDFKSHAEFLAYVKRFYCVYFWNWNYGLVKLSRTSGKRNLTLETTAQLSKPAPFTLVFMTETGAHTLQVVRTLAPDTAAKLLQVDLQQIKAMAGKYATTLHAATFAATNPCLFCRWPNPVVPSACTSIDALLAMLDAPPKACQRLAAHIKTCGSCGAEPCVGARMIVDSNLIKMLYRTWLTNGGTSAPLPALQKYTHTHKTMQTDVFKLKTEIGGRVTTETIIHWSTAKPHVQVAVTLYMVDSIKSFFDVKHRVALYKHFSNMCVTEIALRYRCTCIIYPSAAVLVDDVYLLSFVAPLIKISLL